MIELKVGDLAVVKTSSKIAGLINAGQRFLSKDGEAVNNHAFLITRPDGETFESLLKIDHYRVSQYLGCPVWIVRHVARRTSG